MHLSRCLTSRLFNKNHLKRLEKQRKDLKTNVNSEEPYRIARMGSLLLSINSFCELARSDWIRWGSAVEHTFIRCTFAYVPRPSSRAFHRQRNELIFSSSPTLRTSLSLTRRTLPIWEARSSERAGSWGKVLVRPGFSVTYLKLQITFTELEAQQQ